MNQRSIGRLDTLITTILFVGLLAALVVLPRLIPAAPGVVSAATADGYNTAVAFWTALGWALLTVAAVALRARLLPIVEANPQTERPSPSTGRGLGPGSLDWRELLLVFAVLVVAYLPPVLARYGPYVEDTTFLVALGRLACGDLPYRDFAFLYGPLMIYPLRAWSQLFGASMTSYYGYLALLEGALFVLVAAVLQYFVPDRRRRYLVFVLLVPFLFNDLLGLNYNALRWMVPSIAVLFVAHRPFGRGVSIGCAIVLGLHLAYSHEFAIAGILATSGIYGGTFLWGTRAASVRAVAVMVTGSATTWLVASALLTRGTMPAYVAHAADIVRMMSAGHAGFRFYWTANSLVLFGLLAVALMAVGKGLHPRSDRSFDAGDRFLVGAVLFALVSLKSGLTRSDVWHFNPGFLPLLLAALLRLPASAMAWSTLQSRVAFSLVAVASVTVLVGIAPTASLYATSYVRGAVDVLTGVPRASQETALRTYSLEFERTQPRREFIDMGRYLAEGSRHQRPVLFYGRSWDISPRVGVCPAHFKLDDLMYTEFDRPEVPYLQQHPDALIVIRLEDYRRLSEPDARSSPHSRLILTPTKRIGQWLSTTHYDAAETEARLQDETRERLSGDYIRSTYELAVTFGEYAVLQRSP